MFNELTGCRICGNKDLLPIVHLGQQYLTGVFPRKTEDPLTCGPLELVRCNITRADHCGLVQLRHSYESSEIYGDNYGYRSSLNRAMAEHLRRIVNWISSRVAIDSKDMILDIGSNDGTLLSFYPERGPTLVGIDPSSKKFAAYYKPHIHRIEDFFSAEAVRKKMGDRRAKVITSIAMFYDLEKPIDFVRDIAEMLADDGVWFFEQSYLPSMMAANAYDTICHEHLEYYALRQIQFMLERAGLRVLDVDTNNVNGGSFSVLAARQNSAHSVNHERIKQMVYKEAELRLDTDAPHSAFRERTQNHRRELTDLVHKLRREGKRVFGYGASTKGNVILQYCGFTPADLTCVAEVNADKFGCFTPGTHIPIVSEADAKALKPDYFLVLPWHFKQNLIEREKDFLRGGGKMLFPLPSIEVVS
jgi:hypothetical protein